MMEMDKIHFGDCLEIMNNIDDKSIDMICIDPPFGITVCDWDSIIPFDKLWKQFKRIRKDNTPILIFGKQPFTTMVNMSNIDEFKYEIIWKKQQATNPMCSKTQIMPIHENISVFYKEQCTYNPQMSYGHKCYSQFKGNKNIGEIYGDIKSSHRECLDGSRYPVSVLEYNNVRGGLHPTQKPIELLEYLIKTFSNEGDLILDCCSGSGSTAIASIDTNRHYICIEKEENYYNLSLTRERQTKIKRKLV